VKKYIVITTINPITSGVKSLLDNDFHLVIVGDLKTPNDYQGLKDVFFLDIAKQKELFPGLADLIPYNHYCRKNLGYLYAVSQGADLILDTDDDNIFDPDSLMQIAPEVEGIEVNSNRKWINVYSLFSEATIWPRGLPLNEIHSGEITSGDKVNRFCPIQQYLVDDDPDVDAVFRLVFNGQRIVFNRENDDVILSKGNWCPFNSQSTIFFKEVFPLLYLPTTVPSRVTDIWRSFVAQATLWKHGYELVFRKPIAYQERNPHNLLNDFKEEFFGFIQNSDLIETLELNDNEIIGDSHSLANTARHYLSVMIKKEFLESKEDQISQLWYKTLSESILNSKVIT
jgi:hypothetical protein